MSTLGRQVTEAVRISREGLESLLNCKSEFGSNNLSELVVKAGDRILINVPRKRAGVEEKGEEKDGGRDWSGRR